MFPNLERNGTPIYPESYGLTGTRHIRQQVKNLHSCNLDLISVIQQKLPCYHLEH